MSPDPYGILILVFYKHIEIDRIGFENGSTHGRDPNVGKQLNWQYKFKIVFFFFNLVYIGSLGLN